MEESNNLIEHEHINPQHAKWSTARGQLRRRRRRGGRRRGHKKGRTTMEGIRLRSDSDGSTKNAFYQGTIVSDSRRGNVIENDFQFSDSNQSEVLQNSYPRRKIKAKNEYSRGIPPPPPTSRRSTRNSSLESIDDPYRLISPENSNSNTEDDDPIFNFSPDSNDHKLMAGQRDWTHQRDSLRYSTLSFPSVASQRKSPVGTNLLNDDGSRDSDGEPFAELNIESPLFGISKSDDEDDLGGLHIGNKAGRRRSSLFSVTRDSVRRNYELRI
jgi:hypothetical protein